MSINISARCTIGDNMPVMLDDTLTIPPNAFLLNQDGKPYPLDKTIINIGRSLENQLVIDDRRVSRSHAQLRAVKGRYVLFDLNSTGGTYVNGQRINQAALYPNDTVSFGGVGYTYSQDTPHSRTDLAHTVTSP